MQGEESFNDIIEKLLHDGDTLSRLRAIEVLDYVLMFQPTLQLPSGMLNLFATALNDTEPDIRMTAAQASSRYCDQSCIPLLEKAALDKDDRVRAKVLDALGHFHEENALDPIISALTDPNKKVRLMVARALLLQDHPAIVDPLARLLTDPVLKVSTTAAMALHLMHEPRGTDFLSDGLLQGDTQKRMHILYALFDLEDFFAIECINMPAVVAPFKVPLLALHDHPETKVRYLTAMILGQSEDPDAIDALVNRLIDAEEDVRAAAAEALGRIGDECAVEPLIHVLSDSSNDVRRNVISSLESIGDMRCIEPILQSIHDEEDARMKQMAYEAILQIYLRAIKPAFNYGEIDLEEV